MVESTNGAAAVSTSSQEPPPTVLDKTGYFYGAYALVILGLLVYVVWIAARLKSLEQKLGGTSRTQG